MVVYLTGVLFCILLTFLNNKYNKGYVKLADAILFSVLSWFSVGVLLAIIAIDALIAAIEGDKMPMLIPAFIQTAWKYASDKFIGK